MFGNKKKLEEQLAAEGGTVAWATITQAQERWDSGGTGRTGGTTEHMKVSVCVEPDGQEPFDATFKQVFSGNMAMKGWQCKVIFDPADRSRIAIIGDSIMPPGVTHDRAERGADLRTQMRAASHTGKMPELVQQLNEQLVAKARAGDLSGIVFVNGKIVSGGGSVPGGASADDASAEPAKPDVIDQLTKLADLHDRGVLTDAEFAAEKTKILAQ